MYAKVIPSKPKSVKQIITINTKVKTLSKGSNSGNVVFSSGFANILTLTLITCFIASAIFMIIYNILK